MIGPVVNLKQPGKPKYCELQKWGLELGITAFGRLWNQQNQDQKTSTSDRFEITWFSKTNLQKAIGIIPTSWILKHKWRLDMFMEPIPMVRKPANRSNQNFSPAYPQTGPGMLKKNDNLFVNISPAGKTYFCGVVILQMWGAAKQQSMPLTMQVGIWGWSQWNYPLWVWR